MNRRTPRQPSRRIGVITYNRHSVFQSKVIDGIEEIAADHHCVVEIDDIAADDGTSRPVSLDFAALSGVIVIANVLPDDTLRGLYRSNKPISLISHQIADTPIPAVIPDNAQGIAVLAQYLVETCERRRIVYIGGDMAQNDGIARTAAFEREMMRYNTMPPPHFRLDGGFQAEKARSAVAELVREGADFDAILAADYLMALAAWDALREAAVRVPEDVQIVGFGDGIEAEHAGLTTVAADVIEQGRRGMRQLIGQIDGLRIRGVTVLKTHLIVRNTTC